jgi:exosortase
MSTITPPQESPEPITNEVSMAEKEPLPGFIDTIRRWNSADWTILGLAVALFGPLWYHLFREWSDPHAPQSYGMLVLPAAGALAWMLRGRVRDLTPKPTPVAAGLLLPGLLLLAMGTLIVQYTIGAFGFVLATAGIVWMRYGTQILRRMVFPLAFLLAMVPLPHEMMNMMTFRLQQISVKWAATILRLFGEVRVEGTRVFMPNYTLDVIAPCSGMTIVLPLLVLVVYYLYLVVAPFWKKVALLLLTFPVALVVNAVRVALIGVVGDAFGNKAATNFHDYSGLITVVCGFGVLYFIAQEMRCHEISEEIAL